MNLLPVIERELKGESRNPANYWLRLIAASALLGLGGLYVVDEPARGGADGWLLFERMNQVLQVTIFFLVPIMTADSIAREKREGTLGLLFLTPLRARDIIIGKCLVLGLRALTVLVATLPMLCLPLMMGGVAWDYLLTLATMNFCALCLALAAGVHASTRQVDWFRAVGHALLASAGAAVFFFSCAIPVIGLAWPVLQVFATCFYAVVGVAVLWLTVNSSAVWLARNWQREIARPPQPAWVNVFAGSPFWRGLFRWNRAKTLDRNPMAWLQEYSWTARLTKWGWFILVLSTPLLGGCLGAFFMDYTSWLSALTLLLAGGMAFTGTASFREDRMTGALELLLVTPLTTKQILNGRLWGLIAHFLPASLLLGFFWFVPFWFESRIAPSVWANFWFGVSTLGTIPLVALWFALRRMQFVAAWLLTLLAGYVAPFGCALAIQIAGGRSVRSLVLSATCFTACQVLLAAECHRRVRRALDERSFAAASE